MRGEYNWAYPVSERLSGYVCLFGYAKRTAPIFVIYDITALALSRQQPPRMSATSVEKCVWRIPCVRLCRGVEQRGFECVDSNMTKQSHSKNLPRMMHHHKNEHYAIQCGVVSLPGSQRSRCTMRCVFRTFRWLFEQPDAHTYFIVFAFDYIDEMESPYSERGVRTVVDIFSTIRLYKQLMHTLDIILSSVIPYAIHIDVANNDEHSIVTTICPTPTLRIATQRNRMIRAYSRLVRRIQA